MDNRTRPGTKDTGAGRLDHLVEARDMQPDVCMLYPEGEDERRRTSAWISAKEPSFVDLSTRR